MLMNVAEPTWKMQPRLLGRGGVSELVTPGQTTAWQTGWSHRVAPSRVPYSVTDARVHLSGA